MWLNGGIVAMDSGYFKIYVIKIVVASPARTTDTDWNIVVAALYKRANIRKLAALKCKMCDCGFCFIFSQFLFYFYFKTWSKCLMEFAFGSPLYDMRCAKVYRVSDAKGGWLKTDRRYYCIMSGFQGPPPPFGYQQAPYSGPYAQQVPVPGTVPTEMLFYGTCNMLYNYDVTENLGP